MRSWIFDSVCMALESILVCLSIRFFFFLVCLSNKFISAFYDSKLLFSLPLLLRLPVFHTCLHLTCHRRLPNDHAECIQSYLSATSISMICILDELARVFKVSVFRFNRFSLLFSSHFFYLFHLFLLSFGRVGVFFKYLFLYFFFKGDFYNSYISVTYEKKKKIYSYFLY